MVVCITGKHCNILFSFPVHALQFTLQCHLPCNTRCNAPHLSCITVHLPCSRCCTSCNIFVHLAMLSDLQYMLQHALQCYLTCNTCCNTPCNAIQLAIHVATWHLAIYVATLPIRLASPSAHLARPSPLYCIKTVLTTHTPSNTLRPTSPSSHPPAEVVITVWPCSSLSCCRCCL